MKILRSISFIALASAIAIVAFNLYSVRDNLQAQINSLAGETNAQLGEIANGLQTIMGSSFTKERAVGAAGTEVPTVVALFSTSLASAISSSATSMTLVSATDKDGNALASSTYPFIIDEGTASEELVIADCTSTACTGMIRGVSVLTGTSSVTALKKSHRRGASVKITDGPQLMILSRMLNGIGRLPNIIAYASNQTFTLSSSLVDKNYVDSGVLAGGALSTESVTGITRLATQLQMASSTFAAGTPTVLYSKYSTSTPSASCGLCTPITQNNGKLHQLFLDLTQAYTWTGHHIFSSLNATIASSTNATSTNLTVTGNAIFTGATLTGVAATASSSVWVTSGTWNKPTNAVKVFVQGWGGGGSGQNADAAGSGGGGGGLYTEQWLLASDLTSSVTITIGAGGVAVATQPTNGNAGSSTTFGGYATSTGGSGGSASANNGAGGSGGNVHGTALTFFGAGGTGAGGPGYYSAAGGGGVQTTSAGAGGASTWGGAGGGGSYNGGTGAGGASIYGGGGGAGADNATATTGAVPGGGGGANSGTGSSGAGGAGKMIVTTFF